MSNDIEEPYVIVFFSIDLVDSTKKKYENKAWFQFVKDFYDEFSKRFLRSHNHRCGNSGIKLRAQELTIWKSLGDEIVYSMKVSCLESFEIAIESFLISIKEMNQASSEKDAYMNYVKGTIWLAQVPIIDREFNFRNGDISYIDYLGPSIDTGFRISKYSQKNRVIISVEVLYLLANIKIDYQKKGEVDKFGKFNFYYLGDNSLKGVLNNRPYPIFWLSPNEEALNDCHQSIKRMDKVISFCIDFYDRNHDNPIIMPPLLFGNDYLKDHWKEELQELRKIEMQQYNFIDDQDSIEDTNQINLFEEKFKALENNSTRRA